MKITEQYIDINGIKHWVKLSIRDKETIPIIVIHGGPGGYNYVYERVPGKELEKHLSVIYYEQRGCGRSEEPKNEDYRIETLVDDLNQLIKALKLKKVNLLGFSFGAELAVEYTLRYPETVGKLVLQSPSDFSNLERIFRIQSSGIRKVITEEKKRELDIIISQNVSLKEKYDHIWSVMDRESSDNFLFYDNRNAEWNRKQWEECGLINTGKMAAVIIGRECNQSVCESSKAIEKDTLIIVGEYDKNVGFEIPQEYCKNIKHSKLVVFEKSAHFPDIEETERYVNEVVRHLCSETQNTI